MTRNFISTRLIGRICGLLWLLAPLALAQSPGNPPPSSSGAASASTSPGAASSGGDALASLEWLSGCWRGSVNQREFREHWMPAAGAMMVGVGHTVLQGRTQDYQYLRLEARADGLYYVALSAGQPEATFRLAGTSRDEVNGADIWMFANVAEGFPQRIVYRRGAEGWLYAGIEGTLNGEERKVLYPMRRVSCETGELLRK